jgi:hypothetical protein
MSGELAENLASGSSQNQAKETPMGPEKGKTNQNDQILTALEVALELRCSKAQVYKLLNGEVQGVGALPHIALGRKKVIRRSSFEAWKAANETGILPDDQNMNAVDAEKRISA